MLSMLLFTHDDNKNWQKYVVVVKCERTLTLKSHQGRANAESTVAIDMVFEIGSVIKNSKTRNTKTNFKNLR